MFFNQVRNRGGVPYFKAFTLAEVLITLGIIGVVAALTIPTLISNYQKQVYVTRLQKGISVLNNGVRLMMADEGVDTLDQVAANTDCSTDGSDALIKMNPSESERACINNYFSKYFKIVNYNKLADAEEFTQLKATTLHNGNSARIFVSLNFAGAYGFQTQDGMIFYPWSWGLGGIGIIDVTGTAGPNEFGRDIFFLSVNDYGYYSVYGVDSWNKESSIDYCGDNAQGNGYACSARIMAEGWKMKY